VDAIKKGLVLPKEHGDLIDRISLLDHSRQNKHHIWVVDIQKILLERVVIPAEKGE
jgi:hypothetical protein